MNLFLLRASWRTFLLAVLVGAASGLSSIGLVALVHRALRPGGGPTWLAGAFVALCVVALATRILSQSILVRLSQSAISRLNLHLCRRILDVPLERLEQIGSHRLLTALTNDVTVIAMAANGLPTVCVNLVVLAAGMAWLGWLSPVLLAASLVFLVLGVAAFRVSARYARRRLKQAREDQDVLMRHVRSLIEGVKELKLHRPRREEFLTRALQPADAEVRRHQAAGLIIQSANVAAGRLLFFVAIGLLLFVWPRFHAIDAATLSGYTLTILFLMSPLEGIMAYLPLMTRARVSLRKVKELGLSLDNSPSDAASSEVSGAPISPPPAWEKLELVGAAYAYGDEWDEKGFSLGPIDLSLHAGELLYVIGGNGSGKTTLIKLLTGLYPCQAGEIRLDGRVVLPTERESYRQLFSVVFADIALFECLYGLDVDELDSLARQYLEQLHLDRQVQVNHGELSTTDLSKGQRKRLALLTAYLEDRPIYVFDEWAADQDPQFKKLFYTRLLPELKSRGKAVVVITHDDRYFALADRVVTLYDGKIREEKPAGELAELLAGERGAGT